MDTNFAVNFPGEPPSNPLNVDLSLSTFPAFTPWAGPASPKPELLPHESPPGSWGFFFLRAVFC
jgi:hypothetical protein